MTATEMTIPSGSPVPPSDMAAGTDVRDLVVNPNAPRVYSIVDFSTKDKRRAFALTANPVHIAEEFRNGSRTNEDDLISADRLLITLSNQLTKDEIGGEDFSTIIEMPPQEGLYSGSLHYMRLGARGEQKFHYHPPGDVNGFKYEKSSQRVVLVYPLYYKQSGSEERASDGITFEWFQDEDSKVIQEPNEKYPYMVGKPVSPLYRAWIPPGHIALVTFGAGVHHFKGTALAISAHFFDIASFGKKSYLGNTAGWRGGEPPASDVVNVDIINNVPQTNSNDRSLRELFTRHGSVMRTAVERHVEKNTREPLSEKGIRGLVDSLRSGVFNFQPA